MTKGPPPSWQQMAFLSTRIPLLLHLDCSLTAALATSCSVLAHTADILLTAALTTSCPPANAARKKRAHDKESRLSTVMAGREGRSFGASSGMKKSKTGGLSEREKQRKKAMPLAARKKNIANRTSRSKANRRKSKDFKGHSR